MLKGYRGGLREDGEEGARRGRRTTKKGRAKGQGERARRRAVSAMLQVDKPCNLRKAIGNPPLATKASQHRLIEVEEAHLR